MLKCPRNHSFDIAREKYINLLLSGRKTPKTMGDTKPMLLARRRFLESGQFDPLSNMVNTIACMHLKDRVDRKVVATDVGCGEGYFVGRLHEQLVLQRSSESLCTFGVDISKEAIRMSSKRHRNSRFVVADVKKKLPFATGAVNVLLNMFSPRNPAEFHRASEPSGLLLIVIPGQDHLNELRAHLNMIGIERKKRQQIVNQMADRFRLDAIEHISLPLFLEQALLSDLMTMTPNYWHLEDSDREWMESVSQFRVTASFEILVFRRVS